MFSQYWGDHPKLFASISKGENPEERLLNATRWFISTLYGSYSSRSTTAGMEKKPYNPVLGEQYFAQWTGDAETGDTVLKAEQVSHHPPVSVVCLLVCHLPITPRFCLGRQQKKSFAKKKKKKKGIYTRT
jgi:hypothetical protein